MKEKKKVLYVTAPLVGHMLPAVGVIRHYSKLGYSFSVVCEKKYSKIFRQLEEVDKVHEVPLEFDLNVPNIRLLGDYQMYFQLPAYNKKAADFAEGLLIKEGYDAIASDFFMAYSHMICKKHSIGYWMVYPIVYPFREGTERSFRFYPTPISRLYYPLLNRLRKFWFNLLYWAFIFPYALSKGVKADVLSQEMPKMEKVIVTPPREFHSYIRSFPRNVELIPYLPEPNLLFPGEFSPPNNGKQNILISLGTIFNKPARAKNMLKKLHIDMSKYNVFITGPEPDDPGELNYLYNISLSSILPHIDLLLSHGGTNSLILAHHFGVKTVITPQGGDQFENLAIWRELH